MAGADYAHCDGEPCLKPNGSTKVFYDADTDIPDGTVILHAECAAARQAVAEQRGYERAIEVLRKAQYLVGTDSEVWWYTNKQTWIKGFQAYLDYLESLPDPAGASSLVKGDSERPNSPVVSGDDSTKSQRGDSEQ